MRKRAHAQPVPDAGNPRIGGFPDCAVAQRWGWHIFTTNRDFECFYGQVLELTFYAVA